MTKKAAVWFAAASCAFAAAARTYTNAAVTVCEAESVPFMMDVKEGIRVVRPGIVKITYSDSWDGQEGGTVTVTAGDDTFTPAEGGSGGEGVCEWAPVKTGVNILTHTCGGSTLTAKLFLPGATNAWEVLADNDSDSFPMDVKEGIRVVRRDAELKITYSDRWGEAAAGETAAVTAENRPLTTAAGEGESVWTPTKIGVNILTHTYSTDPGLTAKLFVPGATNACEELAGDDSGPFPMDVQDGIRPVRFATVTGITYSDRWNGEPGGDVAVTGPDEGLLYSGAGGENVCNWTPAEPGSNTLHHTYAGKTLDAHFLVMADIQSGKPYGFQLAEPDPVLDSRGEPLYAGPYTWALAEGKVLPDGLTLGEDGTISGTPACRAGVYPFTAVITDTNGKTFEKTYPLLVLPGGTVIILR